VKGSKRHIDNNIRRKLVNKIKLLTVAALCVVGTSQQVLPVANAYLITSGVNCSAANLNQALEGMGWSQRGVQNNAASPFFVVCPADLDEFGASNTAANVVATFPGATGTVECTARAQAMADGSFISVALNVDSGVGSVGTNRGFANAALTFTDFTTGTIVCALDPGEGIEAAWGQ
jgi:hypothetical protein